MTLPRLPPLNGRFNFRTAPPTKEAIKKREFPMALCRCLSHAPKGRRKEYVRFVEPVGYPDTALVCKLCENPAVIWLTIDEVALYEKGLRIFRADSSAAGFRAGENGFRNNGN